MTTHLARRQRYCSLSALLLLSTVLAFVAPAKAVRTGETFRDWTARCEPIGINARDTCYIYQDVLLKKDKRRLVHIAVGYLSNDRQPAALLTLPLGVSLPGGVSLQVDDGPPQRLRYERCDGSGCVAPLALTDGLIRSMKVGREARVSFFDGSRRQISVPVSLLGFTAGFNALPAR